MSATPTEDWGTALTTDQIATASPEAADRRSEEEPGRTTSGPESAMDTGAEAGTRADAEGEGTAQLLESQEIDAMTQRWQLIQVGFVDRPRDAVQEADALVAELMQRLARMFADERKQLEAQWAQGDEVSTEDLRVGLQRYRSFFHRLLAV